MGINNVEQRSETDPAVLQTQRDNPLMPNCRTKAGPLKEGHGVGWGAYREKVKSS